MHICTLKDMIEMVYSTTFVTVNWKGPKCPSIAEKNSSSYTHNEILYVNENLHTHNKIPYQ